MHIAPSNLPSSSRPRDYHTDLEPLAPGPVHTGEPSSVPLEVEEQLNRSISLGRCGQPEDIATAITFFRSKEAAWITVQVMNVDGSHRIGGL